MTQNRESYKSHSQIAEAISKLVFKVSGWQWVIGDLVLQALDLPTPDGGKLILRDFHEQFLPDIDYTYLSRAKNTSAEFDEQDRAIATEKGATWSLCNLARESRNSCASKKVGSLDDDIQFYLDDALDQRSKTKQDNRKTAKKRIAERVKSELKEREGLIDEVRKSAPEYLTKMHKADTIETMKNLGEQGEQFNLIWLDPPYGQYYKVDDGQFAMPSKSSPLLTACKGNTRDEAEKVTIECIKLAEKIMAEKSALVLFQAASEPDRIAVLQTAKDAGFKRIIPLMWNKSRPQPGNFEVPFGYQTERILVMVRDWDSFYSNDDLSGRTDVLTADVLESMFGSMDLKHDSPARKFHDKSRSTDSLKIGTVHAFQKPRSLCRYFIEKLTRPGDKVLDAFGCSGSMCLEAISNDRDWLYIESNTENYNLGVSNARAELIHRGIIEDDGKGESRPVVN